MAQSPDATRVSGRLLPFIASSLGHHYSSFNMPISSIAMVLLSINIVVKVSVELVNSDEIQFLCIMPTPSPAME